MYMYIVAEIRTLSFEQGRPSYPMHLVLSEAQSNLFRPRFGIGHLEVSASSGSSCDAGLFCRIANQREA